KASIVIKRQAHYSASLQKTVKKTAIRQHSKYTCFFCSKTKMQR
ncbi:60S ribosomal protein L37a, partial [Lemmus lemmus]